MSGRTDIDVEALKACLLARREELVGLGAEDEESLKPVEVDQTSVGRLSRMDALQTQAMELEIDRRRHVELQRVDGALGRIEDDEYGICAGCGDDIAPKRLENDPTTPVCINCARTSDENR